MASVTPMRVHCTESFIRYRNLVRVIWNCGFWPDKTLRNWASVHSFDQAAARLFEGMVAEPLGLDGEIGEDAAPGACFDFKVEAKHSGVELLVNRHNEGHPVKVWGQPRIELEQGDHQLRFVRFFDWDRLDSLDYRLLEVTIERLEKYPELVGRHALVAIEGCTIFYEADCEAGRGNG